MKIIINRAKAHRFLSKLFCSVMIAMVVVCLNSCKEDESKDESNSTLSGSTWQHIYAATNSFSAFIRLEFTSKTEGYIQIMRSLEGVVTPMSEKGDFTYRYDGKNGALDLGVTEQPNFTVSGDKLTFDKNTTVQLLVVPLAGITFIKQ